MPNFCTSEKVFQFNDGIYSTLFLLCNSLLTILLGNTLNHPIEYSIYGVITWKHDFKKITFLSKDKKIIKTPIII